MSKMNSNVKEFIPKGYSAASMSGVINPYYGSVPVYYNGNEELIELHRGLSTVPLQVLHRRTYHLCPSRRSRGNGINYSDDYQFQKIGTPTPFPFICRLRSFETISS